mmetsp:Transcript_16839/g.25467  ORF Transcript_16839/g.25467 Transcript_16839/m.25467 type:complete len:214 (+) Transcript_16839:249-890(+)|eukprot:CAMPEP_0178921714 /NCGR_PEP_ID=MMETSP0786-20121207/15721_1 /TAXON_ID=186022 /ORGANISM="Thalassionema frauenfeldii, Strain CCMP 1798" /LENGTH=213 /DNA_ID=CAMNT_0020595937 /DNA_START=183 /DNA_END=824 /DNA_ORIENTATION=+
MSEIGEEAKAKQESQQDTPEILNSTDEKEESNIVDAAAIENAEKEAETTASEQSPEEEPNSETTPTVLTTSAKKRPAYKYDPEKVTLRFIFANRDGLAVHLECKPADTIGEVKGALLSVWPNELPDCSGGDKLRLICMGKGMLMPDSRSLKDCQVPVFKTHPTPVNVSIKPENNASSSDKPSRSSNNNQSSNGSSNDPAHGNAVSQGCSCSIL